MPTLPTNEDVHKAREQASQAIGGAVEQARTPLLAALGAGDLAAHAVADTVNKVREQLNERAEAARASANDLPGDLDELRDRIDPSELRRRVDAYTRSAVQLYGYLADRGEETLDRLQTQDQVQRAWSQVGTAGDRVEDAVGEVRDKADDVLGKVTRSSRSTGEKAAEATERVAEDTAESVREAGTDAAESVREAAEDTAQVVEDTGDTAAANTRSTARKTANRASAAKSTNGKQLKSGDRKNTQN